jgi:lysophospholipase L1-like esterase
MPLFRALPAVILGALLLCGCAQAPMPDAVRIACVGDSITWGSIIRDRAHNSYPGQLAAKLGSGYVVANFGASGSFVLRSSPKPFRDDPFFEQSLSFQPNIVVLSVGTNDAKPEIWRHGKYSFYSSLAQLIETYQSLPEHPRVILALPPPLFAQKQRGENLDLALRPKMKKLAMDMGIELIDLAKPFRGRKELFWDGIHPNVQACGIMAQTVATSISGTRPLARLEGGSTITWQNSKAE